MELRACPYCEETDPSAPAVRLHPYSGVWSPDGAKEPLTLERYDIAYVVCQSCGSQGPIAISKGGTPDIAEARAKEAWNTRADEERIRRETIEECAKIADLTSPYDILGLGDRIRALAERNSRGIESSEGEG